MISSPTTLTPGTAATMTVSPSRPSTPSTSGPSHSYTHQHGFQQNHHHHHHRIANHPPTFHSLTQPGKDLTLESNSPIPPDLSPVQLAQSHFEVGQTDVARKHSCMWANCHAVFGSLQDLVAHVNVQHLQTVSASLSANDQPDPSQGPASNHHQPAPAPNSTGQVFPSCHWRDCHVYPTVEDVLGLSDRPLDAAVGVLAAHLWEYHLGLPSPPSQFTFPSAATTLVAETAGDLDRSPSFGHIVPKVQAPAAEVEMMDMTPPPVLAPSAAAQVDPVVVGALTSPELGPGSSHEHDAGLTQDEKHPHDQGHDCTAADHLCKWLDCQERFATCEALMTHITAEHVGGGKNHYGCFWDGCGRNGDKGFKSKQKICRHLQVCSSRSNAAQRSIGAD